MALSTVELLENALKTLYIDPIIKTIDEQSGPVLAAIEKTSQPVVGNVFKFGLQYGRHGGIGARAEDDSLPTPSPRSYIQGTASPKNLYGRINFTEKLMLTSKNNQAAFIDAVSTQMEDITNDARDMMRRNIMGTSDGIMGTVKSAAGSVITVEGNIKPFYVGQVIDTLTVASGAVTKTTDAVAIVDVDYAAGTITLARAATAKAGDVITLAGNYQNELIGLREILTLDTTIYGIDRKNNKWFNPHVYQKGTDGAPVAFNSMFLQEAIDDIDDFTGQKPNFICCDAGIQRAYIEEQNTYKRNLEYKNVDGGYKTIAYNDVAISKEKYMQPNTIYMINTDNFMLAQLADWGWMDADGAILARVADRAAYEATLTKYAELVCKHPAAQAVITGIAEV